jgi:hypothetical protein
MGERSVRRRVPVLLMAGVALLAVVQGLHFGYVGGIINSGRIARVAEQVSANITPLAWCAYLVTLLGLLTFLDRRSYLGRFRNRFVTCWLWSVPAWCYFDWMNFYFMRDSRTGLRAWEYVNLPPWFGDRLVGYLFAFGAIAPGMFLTAEVLERLIFWRVASRPTATGAGRGRFALGVFCCGILLSPIPILVGGPASNLAIWVGTWALLDPINWRLGRPSIIGDWFAGRWGRTLALGAGGLVCGFLWEFWNYWSWTKWVYHLPFLGAWEQVKYFEMPVPGLIGFIAFGIETWTMWQTTLLLLAPFVEGERRRDEHLGDRQLWTYGCF